MEEESEWYTPKEVADLLKINYETVLRGLNSGKFPGLRVGKLWRIHKTVFAEMVKDARLD